jgi:hypothetical protein
MWKNIKKYGLAFLSILGTITGILILFRKKDAVLDVDSVLENQQNEVQDDINKIKDDINDLDENGVDDLDDNEIEDYWNRNL